MTYPEDLKIKYEYYSGSDLIRDIKNYNSGYKYATVSYNAFKQIKQIDYGEKITSTYSYDSATGLLDTIIMVNEVGKIWEQEYKYYPGGDIKRIEGIIQNNIFHYNYTYDNLHRLETEVDHIDYDYLSTGKINNAKIGSNELTYTYNNESHRHAIDTVTVKNQTYNYKYDKNGNMIQGPDLSDFNNVATREVTYNIYNKPTQIKLNNEKKTSVSYLYDGEGVRAKKTIEDDEKKADLYYIGKHYIQDNGEIKQYIFAGDLRIARIDNNGVTYYHKDHLGSTIALTNEAGELLAQTSYHPFGTERSSSISERYKYTDQEYDSDVGLYNYNARLYDPVIGRFITPDSVLPNVYDPQSLDPYAYCRNNPLMYVDPSGNISFNTSDDSWIAQTDDTLDTIAFDTGFAVETIAKLNQNAVVSSGVTIHIPQTNRIKMFQEATKTVGTTDYAFENAKGNFSSQTHKCNLFVNDIFEQSTGLDFPKRTRFFIERGPVTASSLASNNELENTTVVIIPKVGDIISFRRDDFSDATGHTAIYTGKISIIMDNGKVFNLNRNSYGTIGAGSNYINYRSLNYLKSHNYINPVYRRVANE